MYTRVKAVTEADLRMLGNLAHNIQRVLPVTQADIDTAAALGKNWVVWKVVEVSDPIDNLRGGTQLVIKQNSVLPGQNVRRVLIVQGPEGQYVIVGPDKSPLLLPDAVADSLQYVKAFGGSAHAGVPAEYDVLSYIEGTANVQYINTGIIPNSNMEIYGKFGVASITAGASYSLFGSRESSGQSDGVGIFIGSGSNTRVDSFFFLSSASDRWQLNNVASVGDIYETTFSNSLQTLSQNGVSLGSHQYVPVNTTTQPMYINSLNNAGSLQSGQWGGRVYRFTVKGICDMIPARRKSDGVVGMYDIIRKQFFTNAGTGSFTAGSVVENLPSEYTQLEYIESTGTQYIDTGFKPNQDSGFIIDYYANATEQPRVFMIAQQLNNLSYGCGIVLGRGANIAVYNGERRDTSYWKCNDFTGRGRYIVNVNKTAAFIKDSTGTRVTYTFPSDTFQLEYNLCLFTLNNEGTIVENTSSVRVYSLKIYDNDVLVRNFVPAKRNSNGEIGMYDLVNHQFYTNAGTGTFTAGVEINPLVPSPALPLDIVCNNGAVKAIRPIEYIESTGTQYIDTGIIYSDVLNARLELDAIMLGASTSVRGIGRSGSYFGGPFVGLRTDGFFGYSAGIDDQTTGVAGSSNERYKYDLNIPASTYVVKDGNNNVLVNVTNITKSTRSETSSCILFGYYGNPNTGDGPYKLRSMKIYSCKIYDDGTLVRDFIPALDVNNVPCMFDKVEGKYYYNAGTGTFVAGPAVYTEPDYEVVGTTETIADSLSNSATAEDLFNLIGAIDEQEILSGNVIHKVGVKILTGSEDWTTESTWFKADILEPSALNSLLCSHFERRVITQDNSVFKNADSSVLMVHYSACSTVDSFKEWLRNQYEAGQPVIVLYPLATPTAESVAGQTLQVADGDNTLTITQASLPDLELEAKYEKQGA